jgi:predicted regulator of amino acid metabolism with ACT domain
MIYNLKLIINPCESTIMQKKFKKTPCSAESYQIVFERGFQVNEEEKLTTGKIEIPHTQLATESGVR